MQGAGFGRGLGCALFTPRRDRLRVGNEEYIRGSKKRSYAEERNEFGRKRWKVDKCGKISHDGD